MRRKEIGAAIRSLLETSVPTVTWTERLTGANRGKDICGSITCDRVQYAWSDKTTLVATAKYSIYLVDTPSSGTVDDIADEVFTTLHSDDLGGLVIDSNILEIIYGAAQGKPEIGIVMMEYEVQYIEEW